MSFKDYFGIEGSLIPGLATGFGGGIGGKGSLCGAFTGSIMAIGMKMGRVDPNDKETVSKVYDACQRCWRRFEREFGSTECYRLIGYRLDDPVERQKWLDTGGKEKCTAIVEKAAQLLCALIDRI